MTRLTLERQQVWIYLAAIAAGLVVGSVLPALAPAFEALLWPALALLLYVTFVQVPLLHTLPDDAPLRLGVLLVPCTDWFVTFSALGGGNVPRAFTVTPLNLLLQLLLPAYLWLMSGPGTDHGLLAAFSPAVLAPALAIVGVPLAAAALTERWVEARAAREVWRERMAWLPVPLLALVVLLIAGAQVGAVRTALPQLLGVVPLFVAYLVIAAAIALALARALRLPADQGRTLAVSLGTRNSFVVLPLALALPAGWELTAMVIVVQSLVELFGMLVYLWWMPGAFRTRGGRGPRRS